MAHLSQSKHVPGYEVRARRCEAQIIYFHVFNVSLSHLGEKQVLVWYWLWQAVVYCGHQWDSMTSSVSIKRRQWIDCAELHGSSGCKL